jgi:hypothetical protein
MTVVKIISNVTILNNLGKPRVVQNTYGGTEVKPMFNLGAMFDFLIRYASKFERSFMYITLNRSFLH